MELSNQTTEQIEAHDRSTCQADSIDFSSWHFRPARASDVDAWVSLSLTSGQSELHFMLGESEQQCLAFLRFGFTANHGLFTWRRHYVACAPDGTVLAQMAVHDYRDTRFDALHLIWMLVRLFGPSKALNILPRCAVLEHEQPSPHSGQVLIKNYIIDEHVQGTNVGRMMFGHAIASGWLRFTPGNQYRLNVRLDNRARYLYERLGFVAQPRRNPPSARLPAELVSVQMVWSDQGIKSVCARAARIWPELAQKSGALKPVHSLLQSADLHAQPCPG